MASTKKLPAKSQSDESALSENPPTQKPRRISISRILDLALVLLLLALTITLFSTSFIMIAAKSFIEKKKSEVNAQTTHYIRELYLIHIQDEGLTSPEIGDAKNNLVTYYPPEDSMLVLIAAKTSFFNSLAKRVLVLTAGAILLLIFTFSLIYRDIIHSILTKQSIANSHESYLAGLGLSLANSIGLNIKDKYVFSKSMRWLFILQRLISFIYIIWFLGVGIALLV